MEVKSTQKQQDFIVKLYDERKHIADNSIVKIVRGLIEMDVLALQDRKAASYTIDELLKIAIAHKPRQVEATPVDAVSIPNGTYTVVRNADENDYVTLRVSPASFIKDDAKTMVSYLAGSDNEKSYRAFAFVNANGIAVWSRFKEDTRIVEAAKILWAIAQTEAGLGEAHEEFLKNAEAYALASGCCARCGRTLTVPASLHRGLGPECAKNEGL